MKCLLILTNQLCIRIKADLQCEEHVMISKMKHFPAFKMCLRLKTTQNLHNVRKIIQYPTENIHFLHMTRLMISSIPSWHKLWYAAHTTYSIMIILTTVPLAVNLIDIQNEILQNNCYNSQRGSLDKWDPLRERIIPVSILVFKGVIEQVFKTF